MPFDPRQQPLAPVQARVLATLLEKARTVPDSYPLTLNALVTGCNQKTSRDPVMQIADAEAQEALEGLRRMSLAVEINSQRATRWEHNFPRGVGVPEQSAVLLGLLMLRGPQTAGELRINTERWYRFADISSVEGFLEELAARPADKGGALVARLPRAPGTREDRWAHLLCGPVSIDSGLVAAGTGRVQAGTQEERITALEDELAALRATVERLCAELGVSPAGPENEPPRATTPSSEQT